MVARVAKYAIEDLPLIGDISDEDGWRSLHLEATGDTLEELIRNAVVVERDSDGEEREGSALEDYDHEIVLTGVTVILGRFNRATGLNFQLEDLEEFFTI